MKSRNLIMLGTGIIAFLSSCDSTRVDFYIVENTSDYSIQSSPSKSGKPIESRTTDTIFSEPLIRGMEDMGNEFLTQHSQEIEMTIIPDSMTLKIDPNNRENWEYSQRPYDGKRDKEGSSGECYYVLRINNDHVK